MANFSTMPDAAGQAIPPALPYEPLAHACRALAGRCDFAHDLDGRGFNSADAAFGHSLADKPADHWTPKMAAAAHKMLRKYRQQLQQYGIEYDALPIPILPPQPPPLPTASRPAPKPDDAYALPRDFTFDTPNAQHAARRIVKDGDLARVYFPFDYTVKDAVKAIGRGTRFVATHATGKHWTVPLSPVTIADLRKVAAAHGFAMDAALEASAEQMLQAAAQNVVESRAADADLHVEGLGGELRPFQKAGVRYALRQKRTFIADQMGLGKTVEALATIHAANAYPALVICPATLKLNWERETKKWLPGKLVAVWSGKDAQGGADVTIINYDVLAKHSAALAARGFRSIVADESHYIKGYKTIRTKAISLLVDGIPYDPNYSTKQLQQLRREAKEHGKGIPYRLFLTGTPVMNRPQELIAQLTAMGRLDDLGGFWHFAKRYCSMERGKYGMNMGGAAHLDELNELMRQTCFIRRNKSDVLKELPPKTRAIVPVAIDNEREYRHAEEDLIGWLRAQGDFAGASAATRAEHLVRIERLKQLAAHGKMKAVIEWVDSFLETGEKLVVFAHHIAIVNALAEHYGAPRISGEVSQQERDRAVQAFQNDPQTRVIVCNIKAGGVGITLTAASNVAFVELEWTPAAHDQAEDRTHRIGQTDSVTAWYLLANETIDADISALIEAKRAVVTAATEGGETDETGILKELTALMLKKQGQAR